MNRILTAIFLIVLICGFSIAQQAVPKDTRITLERSICFGGCDSYKLSVSADGTVTFMPISIGGKPSPLASRTYSRKIGIGKLIKLVAEFEEIDYFSLNDRYVEADCPHWTDHPTIITSITSRGKSKRVIHYLGCKGVPILEKLTALEDKVDEYAGTQKWLRQFRKL